MINKDNNYKRGIFYILITTLAFSTMEIVGKMIAGQIDPYQMTFIRFLIGGLFLFPFALKEMHKRNMKLKGSDLLFFALTGVIGIVISMSFFQTAVLYTKASVVAVIFSTNPLYTAPLAAIILKEKLSIRKIVALFVSLFGVLLIFNPFSVKSDMKGMLLALAAAITFSLYSVISKKRIDKYGGLLLSCFSFLIGDAILLIGIIIFKHPIIAGITLGNLPHLLYLGIFVTGIGYLCYFSAMKYTSAVTTSSVFFIKPGLASILSFVILKETLNINTIIGIILIILASLMMFIQRKTNPV